jgi:hypothetical protein
MSRYVITTRRDVAGAGGTVPNALEAITNLPCVVVVAHSSPNVVTIDTDDRTAERLKRSLAETHLIEPEIRRGLT